MISKMSRLQTSVASSLLLLLLSPACGFVVPPQHNTRFTGSLTDHVVRFSKPSSEWTSDFDDFYISDDDDDDGSQRRGADNGFLLSEFLPSLNKQNEQDLSGCKVRQFSLGQDVVLTDYAGSMGFDEVIDWQYYYPSDDDDDDNGRDERNRQVVQPNPLDPNQPKRTRESSGSVVRIFRAELAGPLGSAARSQGLDVRVLIKEFSGELALDLARAELVSIGKLQSDLVTSFSEGASNGDWVQAASSRTAMGRQDNQNVCALMKRLSKSPYMGILGEVNLAELEGEMDPNEFYRAMGVKGPKSDSIWIVYEYAGLRSLQLYAQPAEARRASLPPQKGFFGNPVPPAELPPWNDRARYVRSILCQALQGLATLHESGVAHRSVGLSSLLMSSPSTDKMEASSVYTVTPSRLVLKLADFGFSGLIDLSTYNQDFLRRARSFNLSFREREEPTDQMRQYAMAEDLHSLGFVAVNLLLTSLAEVSGPADKIPTTDEDTLQRLMTDIFEKDMKQFREYVQDEEEIWENVLQMLDERDGWDVLDALCFARERVSEDKMVTARELLKHPFFAN